MIRSTTPGSSAPSPKTQRRWHAAPVILHGPEALEGAAVLEEFPNSLGVLLWQALRDATLWARTPPPERAVLFASGAGKHVERLFDGARMPEDLNEPLRALLRLARDPGGAAGETVASACIQTSQWAEVHGWTATALGFAQAAALARPAEAESALRVGRLAEQREERARSETWLRRTITMARRSADWTSYTAALLRLGHLYRHRGNKRVAKRFFVRALRASSRRSLQSMRAEALAMLNPASPGTSAGVLRPAGMAHSAAHSPQRHTP
jgi:tetratricopeptide (TPR) repeat protein